MSPEQGMGQAVDGRSDLYSLGVVLYEMATGRAPYEAETPIAVVLKHIRDPLPLPRAINSAMPEVLERVILRAIHKEPSERFDSGAAMVEGIEAIASTKTPDTRDATTLQAVVPASVSGRAPAVGENPLMTPSSPLDDSGRPTEAGSAEPERAPISRATDADDPYPDLGDGTLLGRQIGMRWTTTGNPGQGTGGLLWTAADTYCQGLALGGTASWRLPTQPELDSALQRLDPTRYPRGATLWSSDRVFGESHRLWVTNSPLYAPAWSSAVRDASGGVRHTGHPATVMPPTRPMRTTPIGAR